jgi:hypothetical protein
MEVYSGEGTSTLKARSIGGSGTVDSGGYMPLRGAWFLDALCVMLSDVEGPLAFDPEG